MRMDCKYAKTIGKSDMRRIPPGRRSMTGKMPSRHLPGSVEYESLLEREFLYLLEANGHLRSVKTQPYTLKLTVDGKMRKYTPDVEVQWQDGRPWPLGSQCAVFEVKPWKVLREDWEDLAPKFHAARAHFAEAGIAFRVVTDRFIRGPLLENAKLVVSGLRGEQPSDERYVTVRKAVRDAGGKISFGQLKSDIAAEFEWHQERDQALWWLIGYGFLQAEGSPPITDHTIVMWWTS